MLIKDNIIFACALWECNNEYFLLETETVKLSTKVIHNFFGASEIPVGKVWNNMSDRQVERYISLCK